MFRLISLQRQTVFIPGQERHIGMKEDLRLNLDFNPADRAKFSTVAIQTPPRVLTLEDRPFPSVDDELRNRPRATPRQFSAHHNGVIMSNSPRYKILIYTTLTILQNFICNWQ